jgi:glycosyltransferase involved in cell wall biosynthesis
MILQSDFPPDIRVEKEARALLKTGYTIDLLCNNYTGLATEDAYSGIRVHRLRNKLFSRIINLPLFCNPVWVWKIYSLIISVRPDVIHIHDLPLFLTGAFLGKLFNIPTVFDMHENYPAMLKVTKGMFTLKNPYLAAVIERIAIRIADYIIVVVEEQKERLINLCVPEKKLVIVSNTVDLEYFNNLKINLEEKAKLKSKFNPVVSYIGGFPGRGLETVLQAISIASSKLPKIFLLLIGDGKGRKELERETNKLCTTERVAFLDWVKFVDVPSYINASDICLVPHPSNTHTNTTIPHKLFQYMALGKPVIVTDARPLARIVKNCKCGIVVKSGNANEMADAIITLSDKRLASRLGYNGKKTVKEIYNWRNTSRELIRFYKRL